MGAAVEHGNVPSPRRVALCHSRLAKCCGRRHACSASIRSRRRACAASGDRVVVPECTKQCAPARWAAQPAHLFCDLPAMQGRGKKPLCSGACSGIVGDYGKLTRLLQLTDKAAVVLDNK